MMTSRKLAARVFNIQRFCIHDGPGIRTNVFLAGCNLRCKWCQNPEGLTPEAALMLNLNNCIHCGACIEACPNGAISINCDGQLETDREKCTVCGKCTQVCYTGARKIIGKEYTVDSLLDEVLKDKVTFSESNGGVTLSGGEPTLQTEFAIEFLRKCKENGLHTAIETNGSSMWSDLKRIAEFTDLFLFDIKLFDPEKHKYWTGLTNTRILSNFRKLVDLNKEMIPRVAIIPGVNDDEEEYRSIFTFIKDSSSHLRNIHILPYHQFGVSKYKGLDMEYTMSDIEIQEEKISRCAEVAREMGFRVDIGGSDAFHEEKKSKSQGKKHILYEF